MAPRPSPQTDRVVQLFELLAAEPARGLSLAEVSRRLGVHKASCHSMLSALLASGWLVRDPTSKVYHLGPALLRLGSAAASRFPALDLARPAMAALAAETGGHVIAFLPEGDHVTVAHQVRNLRIPSTPMALGTELPTRPPYGFALAAWAPAAEQDQWLAMVPATTRDRYRRSLDATRKRGYAVGMHVLPDVRLQELASLIRATELSRRESARRGRISDLAQEITEELLHHEGWFPSTISQKRTYDVSHIDAPVIDSTGRVVLMLSVVPVPAHINGAAIGRLGALLVNTTRRLSTGLGAPAAPAAG